MWSRLLALVSVLQKRKKNVSLERVHSYYRRLPLAPLNNYVWIT